MIYKLLPTAEWNDALAAGVFAGTVLDHESGFVHLSGPAQVVETARRYFTGATGLTLLSVEEERLGDALRWEPSRDGQLFPHLYGPLPATAVVAARALPADVPVADAVAALLG
ncbi:DUF952 domain-containing protein [Micromonospora acroterricola]|uniref:DUF952 domain-containing protein n=1 Tax=Micromonospora acroterricola TaxID=2202421 RepID=A0A317D860_9ACTN|nr:DUF952 domain-containing protein [Micromonospora acroterricola]PWR11071.1 DUF952 domain-containing protein [Micromonospora acroterricola]